MRRSTRRKLDVALLVVGAIVVGLGAAFGAFVGRPEQVRSMWATAVVGDDGAAEVTEVIDYDFGASTSRHGIFRVVPGLDPNAPVRVVSPDAPDDVLVTAEVDGTRIRIGAPDRTVTGTHRYEIEYPLPGVVVGDQLAWDAVGTEWNVGMEAVEVHVVAPFELDDPACFAGPAGSRGSCDDVREVEPGHLVATVDGLGAHDGVTVTATRGPALAAAPTAPGVPGPPDDPGTGPLPPAVIAAGAALLAGGLVLLLVRRAGRERLVVGAGGPSDAAFGPVGTTPAVGDNGFQEIRVDEAELRRMATTDFAPPEGITASQGGIVLVENVRPEHRVAWLIEAAIEGSIDMVEPSDGARGTNMTLVRRAPGSPWTASILDRAFAGRSEIELGRYDSAFASGWRQLSALLQGWRAGSDFWDRRAGSRRVSATILGIVSAIVGLIVAVAGGALAGLWGPPWLAVAAAGGLLAGGGVAPVVAGWELYVRTPAGSAAWLRVESFRRFLAESEAYHAEEAAKRGVLREYTAWAVAVGEIDRWSAAVQSSTLIPAEAGIGYVYMAPLLLSSTSHTATAPSSSGSGGFSGGGFSGGVGGGAGGGGGGSW